jgi:LPS export ABC transporter protein LptC
MGGGPLSFHEEKKLNFTGYFISWYNYCYMKRFLKKHWPLLALGTLLTVVGFYLTGAQDMLFRKPTLVDAASQEGLKLQDIRYTQNNPEGDSKWTLDAERVAFSKDRQFMSFNNFTLKLETKDRPSINLKGERGEYDRNTGVINLWGDLKGRTNNGYEIFTDRMIYKNKEGYLTSDAPVKITGPFFSVEGFGFYFHIEKRSLRIRTQVTTSIDKGTLLS